MTTLDAIKSITRGEPAIQALVASDPMVTQVLADVDIIVSVGKFGNKAEIAQRYLAAHFLSQSLGGAGGRGPLSQESIGGISQSFTLPYLNRKDVLGATQYGMQFLSIRESIIVPVVLGVPDAL